MTASLCIVPARRDSKQLPAKVLRHVGTMTLLERGIRLVIDAGCFDEIILTTEDPEIAAIGEDVGIAVETRAASLTGDSTTAAEIAVGAAAAHVGLGAAAPSTVALMAPIYPLLTTDDVRTAWNRFLDTDADFLVSSHPTDPHDFHWALEPGTPYARLHFGDRYLMDRHLLPPMLTPNGAIKYARLERLREAGSFFGERLVAHEIARTHGLQVRDESDLQVAEFFLGTR